jgi:hypothetical protein
MSKFLKGSVSFLVFSPEKQLKSISEVREKIALKAFSTLKPEELKDESIGWVDPILSFDNENFSNLTEGDNILLGIRIDKYSFGASQLRPYLDEALFDFKTSNSLDYITAQQEKDLKEAVIRKLRMNSYPKTTIIEVAWNLSRNIVYLFNQSSSVVLKFVDLFEKTFETTLTSKPFYEEVESFSQKENFKSFLGQIWSVE